MNFIRKARTMYRTDDPERDFDRWQAVQEAKLERLPKCSHCEEHIQDDAYYEVHGTILCPECLETYYKKFN